MSKQTILIAAVVLALAVGGWYFMSGSSTPAPSLTTTGLSGDPVEQGLVATLLQLRAVKLDGTIFTDQAFLTLRDFSTEIVAEPVGRIDPFSPLPRAAAAAAQQASSNSAQIFIPRR